MSIGEQIKHRRKELLLTMEQVADLAEVSVYTLYKLERGTGNPTLEILVKVGAILGLELSWKVRDLKSEK